MRTPTEYSEDDQINLTSLPVKAFVCISVVLEPIFALLVQQDGDQVCYINWQSTVKKV